MDEIGHIHMDVYLILSKYTTNIELKRYAKERFFTVALYGGAENIPFTFYILCK